MRYIYLHIIAAILLILPCSGYALQDSYIGDTAIYGGATAAPKPNVLIIFDSSGSMGGTCSGCSHSKITIARAVVSDLIETTDGVNFGVMRFNDVDDGGRFITSNVDGRSYTTTIKNMDDIHVGTTTNRQALIDIVKTIPAEDWTPLAEALFESMRYFSGGTSAFGAATGNYTSPIIASCQSNYVIIITDGASTQDRDSVLTGSYDCGGGVCINAHIFANGDYDGDGNDPGTWSWNGSDYLDDVAKYLYDTDFSSEFDGIQNVKTFTVAFDLTDTQAVNLLQDTADNGQGAATGAGKALLAANADELKAALTSILVDIQEANTAFVAPVVPTSPENKVYSGQRIYLGFFKPQNTGNWIGNLKKYGLSDQGEVLDKNGNTATDANGAFVSTAISYWSDNIDAGDVDKGGVGAVLAARNVSERNIYTYTGTNKLLTDSTNEFSTDNDALTHALFGVADDAAKNKIINYIYGLDSYDEDVDTNISEQRAWVMGDVLHSKPTIQSYNNYTTTDESNPAINKTVLFVGTNDGQLHAFSDADGSELWSFVPPSFLPYLKNLGTGDLHEYYMDGSPTMYVYDADQDGNIGPGPETSANDADPSNVTDVGADDKVIMIVSMRRGGGIDTLHATNNRGYYYALDVTVPTSPKFLWYLDSTTLGELGETWADPVIGKVRLNGTDRIVAFIGAGYDNNEDLRFGNNQEFPDTTTETTSTVEATADADDVTSPGSSSQINPRGRGIYVLQLATLDSDGVPTVHATPQKLWEYIYDSGRATTDPDNNPIYSFPGEVAPLDFDFDGYIDRLYIGDTGGNMWRFDIGNKVATSNWSATKIFSANPSDTINSDETSATNGRKIFYRPSIVQEPGYVGVYFGTGDRAHPLNKAVIDRLYAVYDRDITVSKTEVDLVNVTEDKLQAANPTADPADLSTCTLSNDSIGCTLQNLYDDQYYGWFIKLDLDDGEKVLANPLVFNKVAYYTTFTPNVNTTDPCLSGNLGVGRVYGVNYKTGEAVFNFDLNNDVADNDSYSDTENERAKGSGNGDILRRSDRFKGVGSGIPSGVVVVIRSDGTSSALVGCGGGLCGGETKDGGAIIPLYWIME